MNSLENKIYRLLKGRIPEEQGFFCCVSGGLDSLVMGQVVCQLRSLLGIKKVAFVYIHHGVVKSGLKNGEVTNKYRLAAWRKVKACAQKNNVPFFSNLKNVSRKSGKLIYEFLVEPETPLKSEEDFREFRYKTIAKIIPDEFQYLVTGHHQEDQLENQLIRLIRGTGAQGLLGLQVLNPSLVEDKTNLRPLIELKKSEIKELAKAYGLRPVVDPSNHSLDPLRNWIRKEWLPSLERKRPGAKSNLAQSLALIQSSILSAEKDNLMCVEEEGICLSQFRTLSREKMQQVIANYMRQQQMNNYSQGHVLEVIRRLDNEKSRLNFRLLRRQWVLRDGYLKALPTSGSQLLRGE